MSSRYKSPRRSSDARILVGIMIAGFGVLLMLQILHLLPPIWYSIHLGFPAILIAIGVLIGVRSGWRNHAWWILMLVGIANLTPAFMIGDVPSKRLFWPALIIAVGIALIFRRRRTPEPFVTPPADYVPSTTTTYSDNVRTNSDSVLNIDVTFGGRKEIVTSKNFNGGRVYVSFGGAEVNLMQADSPIQPMVLDLRVAFGSVELILPSHWELRNEVMPTLGSVEDHRMIHTAPDPSIEKRTLILKGSCFCGSVEIKSY